MNLSYSFFLGFIDHKNVDFLLAFFNKGVLELLLHKLYTNVSIDTLCVVVHIVLRPPWI